MRPLPQLDFSAVRTTELEARHSKVRAEDFAKPLKKGASVADFMAGLPNILAGAELREAAGRVAAAVRRGRPVILGMGGHVVKVGLGPLIIDLMERGVISGLAANGSVMVHDAEAALVGATSEDVAATLGDGQFGVTGRTGEIINRAAKLAAVKGEGLGFSLGRDLSSLSPPYLSSSVFAAAFRLDLPMTVHAAIGTDVYNIHPEADGASLGAATMGDFRLFCRAVADLQDGVFINLGSAVILPEVFLKALTLVRNLGHQVDRLTTVNMDFIRHYRPQVNVVARPTQGDGARGFYFVGHHEIMFPLLMSLVLEQLD
ncbi:hypothetical protein LJB99_06335 [Deltaproteobacteria bacterium OttesenSCG-928-K17]|nr:hypothetical protein [Deltaproteobacteria bacterium OttesenSCG-928-K17]